MPYPEESHAATPVPLTPTQLYRPADLSAVAFETTAELESEPLEALPLYQPRAHDAIRFGTDIEASGFNVFAIGASTTQLRQSVRALVDDAAKDRPPPLDWVYVNNFKTPHRPIAISLPACRAPEFEKAVNGLIDELRLALPAMFESEDYQKRRAGIEARVRGKHEQAFTSMQEKAAKQNVAIVRTPAGFALAPAQNGKVVPPAEFNSWPEEQQKAIQAAIGELEKDLEEVLRVIPRIEKELRDAMRALDRETIEFTITHPIAEARAVIKDLSSADKYFDDLRDDLLENFTLLVSRQPQPDEAGPQAPRSFDPFSRYEINVLVTQADHECAGAPVVEELHPTLGNLIGRVEYLPVQGALLTNFKQIRAGALHRANGGMLLLDARSLLTEPYSWVALKRALLEHLIVIEDVARSIGVTTTVSLEPDPIPLSVRVVLYGDRALYYMLSSADPDLEQHFKVLADFDDDLQRSPGTEALLARLIASLVQKDGLRHFDRGAIARLIEHASRIADDQKKLTLLVEQLRDVTVEASHWAEKAGHEVVGRPDVEKAIGERIRRASRVRERTAEMILRDVALIETNGSRIGQINGLSVLGLGGQSFGRPSRITCRVRPGAGKIVDIEREVELSGPLHSKGVLILAGFLAGRYALDTPMSLSASLVFEQSYGGVDGDSASSTELYAILSALAEVPLRQDLAVTGSVNQFGQVQAIGGANYKIEGYFEICRSRGLTGTQGVLVPESNVQHLMLNKDVVDACASGQFAVYPIRSIDQGIALLTGLPAGERGSDGLYPNGSINRRVEDRLRDFATVQRAARAGDGPVASPKGLET